MTDGLRVKKNPEKLEVWVVQWASGEMRIANDREHLRQYLEIVKNTPEQDPPVACWDIMSGKKVKV